MGIDQDSTNQEPRQHEEKICTCPARHRASLYVVCESAEPCQQFSIRIVIENHEKNGQSTKAIKFGNSDGLFHARMALRRTLESTFEKIYRPNRSQGFISSVDELLPFGRPPTGQNSARKPLCET